MIYRNHAGGYYYEETWLLQILPFIEQKALRDCWDHATGWASGTNRNLLPNPIGVTWCPSSPGGPPAIGRTPRPPGGGAPAGMSFQAGVCDYAAAAYGVEPPFNLLPGIFAFREPPSRMAAVTDGRSNTALVAEIAGGDTLYRTPQRTASGPRPAYAGHWAGNNRLALVRSDPAGTTFFAGNCVVNCANEGQQIYSFHTGGANLGLGDGSVRFMRETADADTLNRAISRSDGRVVDFDF